MSVLLAPCGLDCAQCRIFRAGSDNHLAERIAASFAENGVSVEAGQIRCSGCPGTDAEHWSAECDIRSCAVRQKHVRFCHECDDFDCERLISWAKQDARYSDALHRLMQLRDGKPL